MKHVNVWLKRIKLLTARLALHATDTSKWPIVTYHDHQDHEAWNTLFNIDYGRREIGQRGQHGLIMFKLLSWEKTRARQCKVVGLHIIYILQCGCFALLRHLAGARASTELGSCSLRRSRWIIFLVNVVCTSVERGFNQEWLCNRHIVAWPFLMPFQYRRQMPDIMWPGEIEIHRNTNKTTTRIELIQPRLNNIIWSSYSLLSIATRHVFGAKPFQIQSVSMVSQAATSCGAPLLTEQPDVWPCWQVEPSSSC